MKRAKLGDVYYVKLPNGYKIYQWAYDIPKKGTYCRVFDGLYDSVPDNIAEIVAGPHSYVLDFPTKRSYSLGLSVPLGNYPVPEEYPSPEYTVTYFRLSNGTSEFWFYHMYTLELTWKFVANSFSELPEEYQQIRTLSMHYSPAVVFRMFDKNFDLYHLERLSKAEERASGKDPYQPYLDMIEEAFEKERIRKAIRKEEIRLEKERKLNKNKQEK